MKLTKSPNEKYKKIVFGVVLTLLFFGLSGVLFKDKDGSKHSETGTQVDNNTDEITLNTATYYKESGVVEMSFLFTELQETEDKEWQAIVKETKKDKELTSDFVPVNKHYGVLFISNVPKNWKKLKVTIEPKEKDKLLYTSLPSFYLVQNKTDSKKTFTARKEQAYLEDYYHLLITQEEEKIKKVVKEGDKKQKEIKDLEKENTELLAEANVLTDKEKEDMKSKIQANKNTIKNIESTLAEQEKVKKEHEEKIEKLLEQLK